MSDVYYFGSNPNEPQETIFNYDIKPNDSVYADRMKQWDYKLYNELSQKYFGSQGDYWDGRSAESMEKFLQEYAKIEHVKVYSIVKTIGTNGYPYYCIRFWRSDFENK